MEEREIDDGLLCVGSEGATTRNGQADGGISSQAPNIYIIYTYIYKNVYKRKDDQEEWN